MEPAVELERFASLSAEIEAGAARDEVCAREGILVEVLTGAQKTWLARMAEDEPAAHRQKALQRAARSAYQWPEEASTLLEEGRSLTELAQLLSVSPHHLSRVFRAQTGHTIARHRMRLRARAALDRLGDGEPELARLAAELGFADQAHLTRVVRAETGTTPAALRAALSA